MGRKSPGTVRVRFRDEAPQKPVIFCKLYYNDALL